MNDTLGLLGLCLRAGKLVLGDEAVADCVGAGSARLILLTQDAGSTTAKRARRAAESKNLPVIRLAADADEMGNALGRIKCAVCCITDSGFAAAAAQKAAADFPENEQAAQLLTQKNNRIQARRGVKKHKNAGAQRGGKPTHKKSGGERA